MTEPTKSATPKLRNPQAEDRVNFLALFLCGLAFVIITLALVFSSSAQDTQPAGQETPAGSPPTAQQLTEQGLKLMRQQKLPEALEALRQAVNQDPDLASARLYLAKVYSLLRLQKKVCEYDAYRASIVEQLEAAVRLDPGLLAKIKKDKELAPVRDTYGYQALLGLSPKVDNELKAILTQVTWYGPCPGALGPGSGLKFGPKNKLNLWTLDMAKEGNPKRVDRAGTFKVKDGKVHIKLAKPFEGKSEFEGVINPEGKLDLNGLPGPFGDDPCECEA